MLNPIIETSCIVVIVFSCNASVSGAVPPVQRPPGAKPQGSLLGGPPGIMPGAPMGPMAGPVGPMMGMPAPMAMMPPG